MTVATIKASIKKIKALLNRSDFVGTFVKIFRIILPLLVEYPVLTTKASTSPFFSSTLAPSYSHLLSSLVYWTLEVGNLAMGKFYPVKLA